MDKNDKLPPITEMEEEQMAQIPCSWCGFNHRAIGQSAGFSEGSPAGKVLYEDVLRSVLTCGQCKQKTVFQLERGYGLSYLPGKDILIELN